ncbi:hypothetical protein PAECIP111893_04961 [Paenibacillus plantiphilus]|uniref:DUF2642 domain-containing protein n=1 Tax=Paenibacillus plantiphilus TaxID=2905650 RepID=A0ABM9CUZ3_9BACL|nr:DUF2642 domain-containing protein [Paenibacillus plantiphilus]CAH1223348.1 hypothetical protein PAECIP111893_04961 [Paenibacillus plantiphilus]
MKNRHPLLDQYIEIEVSGKTAHIRGKLIDWGQDILVLHNGLQFLYVPLIHLQQMRLATQDYQEIIVPELPFEHQNEPISYRKMLMNAKGMFSELYITGNQSIHGYLTSVMNDFFVFYSPVYHTVVVSLHHLKYLIPYSPNVTPYTLTPEQFPLKPSPMTLARTFDQQLRKLTGEFVILDLGENPNKIGVLKSIDQNMVELSTAGGNPVFLHFDHVKTVHLP